MDNLLDIIKLICKYSGDYIFILAIIAMIIIYKNKKENENYFILKMIGFYLLGAFTFNFYWDNEIYIYLPVGYLIYYLFMKNKERVNKIEKYKCAKLGLVIMIISCVTNGIYNYLEYRDISMTSSSNMENLSLEWEEIKKRCKIDENIPLNGARIIYDKDGNIVDLNYYIIDYNTHKSYQVDLFNNKYEIVVRKHEYEYNYDMDFIEYITTDDFLKVINHIYDDNYDKEINENEINYNQDENMDYEYTDDGEVFSVNTQNNTYEKLETNNLYITGPAINYYLMGTKEYYNGKYVFDFIYDE